MVFTVNSLFRPSGRLLTRMILICIYVLINLKFVLVGRLVGAACAMCGILVIAMPIPIIVNNFTRQYSRLEPVSKYWVQIKAEEQAQRQKNLFGNVPLPALYLETISERETQGEVASIA